MYFTLYVRQYIQYAICTVHADIRLTYSNMTHICMYSHKNILKLDFIHMYVCTRTVDSKLKIGVISWNTLYGSCSRFHLLNPVQTILYNIHIWLLYYSL